jgi:hypothetical protein
MHRFFWSRADQTDLYDVFEPSYLREALLLPQNFGHLIFGKEAWAAMGGQPSDGLDPLSVYYRPKPRPSVRPKGWKGKLFVYGCLCSLF